MLLPFLTVSPFVVAAEFTLASVLVDGKIAPPLPGHPHLCRFPFFTFCPF